MVRLRELWPESAQLGLATVLPSQKCSVVPQNPNRLQHTLSGHAEALDHCEPQPGSQSDFWSCDRSGFDSSQYEKNKLTQLEMQF